MYGWFYIASKIVRLTCGVIFEDTHFDICAYQLNLSHYKFLLLIEEKLLW